MRDLRRRHGNRADVANYHRTTPFRYWAQQGFVSPNFLFCSVQKGYAIYMLGYIFCFVCFCLQYTIFYVCALTFIEAIHFQNHRRRGNI